MANYTEATFTFMFTTRNLKTSLTSVLCLALTALTAPTNHNTPTLPIDVLPTIYPLDGLNRPLSEIADIPPQGSFTNQPPSDIQALSTPPYDPKDGEDLTPDDYIPTYDCDGSVLCDAMNPSWCDDAVNNYLVRSDTADYYGTTPNATRRGACDGWGIIGCAVFLQGGSDDPKCTRTGNQMWWDYQDIRQQGQCGSCGTKHWYPGCMTTINYVSWCKSDLLDHNFG